MGRSKKILYDRKSEDQEQIIDKREVGYYSTPEFVASYITKRIQEINPGGNSVLDPCCGRGEMLNNFIEKKLQISGIDVLSYKKQYNIDFQQKNFIELYINNKKEKKLPLKYDYYIANPPYNCHEVSYIKENKEKLQKSFKDVGIHNMYSMFISAMIDCAKPGAVMGILTSDSFLTAKFHKKLREKILKYCSIHEITLCPKDLFLSQGADVRTAIIILQKGTEYQDTLIVNNRAENTSAFKKEILSRSLMKRYKLEDVILKNPKDNCEIILECPDEIKKIFDLRRLGERFKCITGISTGNDKLYLSEKKREPFIVPFYKNPAGNRFYANNYIYIHKNFMQLSERIDNFMVRNKKLIYMSGVTCSSMGVEFAAARLPRDCAFGVNANIICEDEDAWWLLAYLNSSLVSYIVRGVLLRSNMITSGYVSRIPVLEFNEEEKRELAELSKKSYDKVKSKADYERELCRINELINDSANLSEKTRLFIETFIKSLVKST